MRDTKHILRRVGFDTPGQVREAFLNLRIREAQGDAVVPTTTTTTRRQSATRGTDIPLHDSKLAYFCPAGIGLYGQRWTPKGGLADA